MSRKINSEILSDAEKAVLKQFIRERTGQNFKNISDFIYKQAQKLRNDEIDERRKKAKKEVLAQSRKPVLLDTIFTGDNDKFQNELKRVSQSLVKKNFAYVQYGDRAFVINVNGSNAESIYWNSLYPTFFAGSSDDPYSLVPINKRVVIILSDSVLPLKLQQKYRDGGEKHCVIRPIYERYLQQSINSVSEASKKRLDRQARQVLKLEQEYPDGVPEEDMEIVAKTSQLCIVIHDIIGNETKRYNEKSKHHFHFTNTRNNHLEKGFITINEKPTQVSQEELNAILDEHLRENVFHLIRRNQYDAICIKSLRGCWELANPENDIMNNFSKEIGIHKYSYDALKYPELNSHILESRIINSAPTPLCSNPNDLDGANLVDLEKAYTQHKACPYYDGFLGVIQQYRKLHIKHEVAKFLKNHLGIFKFRITSSNNKLLNQFGLLRGQEYTLPSVEILYYMKEHKMTCELIAGCWGSRFDFEYTDEMLENRRYCMWAGKQGMQHDETLYTFKGDEQWCAHLKSTLGEDNVVYFDTGYIACKIKQSTSYTRHHILSFITAYTRINMMEIIKQIPSESLIKVVLDGLYFRGELPDIHCKYKMNKLKEHGNFREYWYYPSETDTSKWTEYKKEFDSRCILAGAGGSGKTHRILTDKGFVNPKYIVPMHSLGKECRNKYGVSYDTIHKFAGIGCVSRRDEGVHYLSGMILVDELTMLDREHVDKLINMYPESLIFIAGDIDEKQWYQCRNKNELWRQNWRFIFFEHDYRALDEELKQFKCLIREKMREVFTFGDSADAEQINDWVKKNYSVTPMETAIKMFKTGDVWIAGTHATNAKLIENGIVSGHLKDKEINYSGEGEVRGAFTIHSFQGLTISDKRVFISLDNFEYAMFYTAVSRVRHLNQIVLVH
jgi:hypothetical protein